jgi:sucrose-6-phosphate hydrolase SacC (GH32 family)
MRAELAVGEGEGCGVQLVWADGSTVSISYRDGWLEFDRRTSGAVNFHPDFAAVHRAPLALEDGRLRLQLFIDHSSVELLAQNGLLSMTERIFPAAGPVRFTIFAGDAPVTLHHLEIDELVPARFAS